MLRRGLATCSTLAVSAIERAGWRELEPDLERAVVANDPDFRAHVILALKALGNTDDFADELIAVLSSGSVRGRITAAMGARHFSIDRFRGPLLDRVRQDPSWLVRVHAAESLLELADVYPRGLDDHPTLAAALRDDKGQQGLLLGMLGLPPPLTTDQRARLAVAADQLDAKITERLAAGACSKPSAPSVVDLYVIPVGTQPIVALTVEESIGSCERTLAFVAFVESAGGFSRSPSAGFSGRDPVKLAIQTCPTPVTVTYSRATGMVTVGTFAFDTARVNVAVLSVGPSGVAARYQGKRGLTFSRHGRPPSETGVAALDFQPEIARAVRALVDHTPELRGLVGGAAAGDSAHPVPP